MIWWFFLFDIEDCLKKDIPCVIENCEKDLTHQNAKLNEFVSNRQKIKRV